MRPILALAFKDLRLLVRDRTALFFTLFFPVIFSIFFGLIFAGASGGPRAVKLAVVDEDRTDGSRAFLQRLRDDERFAVTDSPSTAAAEALVLAGKSAGYLSVPKGFGQSQQNMFAAMGGADRPTISVGVDPSRFAEKGMIEGLLQMHAFRGMGEMFGQPSKMLPQLRAARATLSALTGAQGEQRKDLAEFLTSAESFMQRQQARDDADPADAPGPAAAFSPVSMEFKDVKAPTSGPASSFQVSFPQGIIWGIMGCAVGFGISLVVERQRGTLARLRIAPLAPTSVLLGKALACFGTICAVCTLLFLIAGLGFKMPFHSLPLLALAVVCIGVAFVGLMMLAACSGKTESGASGLSWAVMMVFALLGGAAVPTMFMPGFIQPLSSLSPVKWSINAMEGAIWRGFTLEQMLLPCGVLVAVGVASFAIGVAVFSRRGA